MERGTGRIVPAAEKTLRILEYMASAGKSSYGVTEISNALSYNKGTVHPILQTLIANQWVEHGVSSGKYSLTNKLSLLAGHAGTVDQLAADFILVATEMERQCGELINLHYLKGVSRAALVASVPSSQHSLRVDFPVGTTIPVIASSAGKCLVSELDDSYLSHIFETCSNRFTSSTICSEANFFQEIHNARKNGYAINNAEYEEGVYSIAAPVRNAAGHIIAAINVVVPQPRFSPERSEQLTRLICSGANRLSALHGYVDNSGGADVNAED